MQHVRGVHCIPPALTHKSVTVVATRGVDGTLTINHPFGPSVVVKPRVTDILHMLINMQIIPSFVGHEWNTAIRLKHEAGDLFTTRITSLVEQIELPDGVVRTKQSHKYMTLEKGTERCGSRGEVLDPMNLAFVEGDNKFYVRVSIPVC
jgi:hypothetical protein